MYSRTNISQVVDKILEVFQPNVVVLQCGADSLSGDKIRLVKSHDARTRSLCSVPPQEKCTSDTPRRGEYTVKNVVRTWTYEMACALGTRYRLEDVANNMEDMNVKDGSLEQVRYAFFVLSWINVLEHLRKPNSTPSVEMHDVPKESLLEHLGFRKESDTQDKLDEWLAPRELTVTFKNTRDSYINYKNQTRPSPRQTTSLGTLTDPWDEGVPTVAGNSA
ncbi:hypothetical protein EDD18DRAFT_1328145 [Armillaria luteobubalina]|uniref:Uncharacterized protein n=1 Tax=Armillaria luteobubalina TaxID=153913 RepID=A0AA39QHN8_9AGAR|nr:hypothetical protein EDD18DRAFT_1328145 [Armillaria luteobubalina]